MIEYSSFTYPTTCHLPANTETILWDQIMTSFQCCGVTGYLDFADQVLD